MCFLSREKHSSNLWLENKLKADFFSVYHDIRVNGKIFPENEKLRIRNACKNENRPTRKVCVCACAHETKEFCSVYMHK